MKEKRLETIPLGFSDLNQDESLLISIFRIWYKKKENQGAIEHSIRTLLKENKIYPFLTETFIFFRRFTYLRLVHINDNEILSPTEEYLLQTLGSNEAYHDSESEQYRSQLLATMTLLRPIEYIDRSGYDVVQHKIAQNYLRFMMPPPKKRNLCQRLYSDSIHNNRVQTLNLPF